LISEDTVQGLTWQPSRPPALRIRPPYGQQNAAVWRRGKRPAASHADRPRWVLPGASWSPAGARHRSCVRRSIPFRNGFRLLGRLRTDCPATGVAAVTANVTNKRKCRSAFLPPVHGSPVPSRESAPTHSYASPCGRAVLVTQDPTRSRRKNAVRCTNRTGR
jgi:hypothetical protein